jgi:hypothetical protein
MIILEPIPGFPQYLASDNGDIISIRERIPKTLKASMHKGYLHVNVKKGYGRSTQVKVPVHNLILLAFHGPKKLDNYECRHLDGNALNNTPDNLKWGTKLENTQDQIKHGTAVFLRKGEKHPCSKLTEIQVLKIKKDIISGEKQSSIATRYGIDQRHVSDIKNEITWKHLWGVNK